MVKPGFLLMKTSAQRWPRITSVSEPFTVMLRPSAIKATAPVISNAAVPRANFEIFLIFFPPSYSCSSMDPNCFSSVTAAEQLELVDYVKLQALQPRLRRSAGGDMPVERATDQTGEGQLNVLIGLVEDFDAVLADVAVLAQVAEVEGAHDRFAFDEHARVGELNILGFRLAADAAFQPIATALTGEAGPASSGNVGNRLDARGGRRGDRETGNRVSVYIGHDVGHRGRGDGVLNAGSGERKEAVERSLGIAARDGSGESDGVRVVIVVESAVGAQSKPAAKLPYGLDLAAVHFAFHAAPVYPGSVLELGERQRKPDYGKSPDDRRAIVKIPLQGLRDAFGVKVVIPNELRAIERIGNLTAGEHQRLELVGSISDERAINRDRLAGVELDVRLVGRNRIIQIAGGQREPAADV